MENNNIIKAITEKCEFFYGDSLLSKEIIIGKYLKFFSKQFNPDERSISFAYHTGSICFDAVSIAALIIGCLAYDLSSNDEILKALEIGDMVLYKGERYHWGGVSKWSQDSSFEKMDYILLTQDAKGRNGPTSSRIPYERNKHLVKPYFGTSEKTDGRGIRKDKSNRNDFISTILGIPINEVPTTIDFSVVVVSDKNKFIEIFKPLRIRYAPDKFVNLYDVFPVSYYTSSGEQTQIGKNSSKAEAVIKVTSNISMARELVLDKYSNKVIGLLVLDAEASLSNMSELNDLLRRKSLKFAYVLSSFNSKACYLAMEQFEDANMFACTKELLNSSFHKIQTNNTLTCELNGQIQNIINRHIEEIPINGSWSWTEYRELKENIYAIKESNWTGEERDNFILSALALINLFTTSFFSMNEMEMAISKGSINSTVVSPEKRLSELLEIATRTHSLVDRCEAVVNSLMEMYSTIKNSSPKGSKIIDYIESNPFISIALIVPKAYYVDLFSLLYKEQYPNVNCMTVNRFDKKENYDVIISIGDINGKRFDILQCYSSPKILVYLYDYEHKTFSRKKRLANKSEKKLNARIKGLSGNEYEEAIHEDIIDEIPAQIIKEFSELDEYVESIGFFDIKRLASQSTANNQNSVFSEVQYVGTFTTGEQILFSKYYQAVVFDQVNERVIEKSPEKLESGDILVFTKKNDYTRNIVDQLFDLLMRTHKLSDEVQLAAVKAFYWKEALRDYKEKHKMSYSTLAKVFRKMGSSLQEVSIRQWLIEESTIVGPRELKTMEQIAKVTNDPDLLSDPESYYEACRTVRHYRREILSMIAMAINEKLSNKTPIPGSISEIIYNNIDKLSETIELENVIELDEVIKVSINMVNRPITESEVLL